MTSPTTNQPGHDPAVVDATWPAGLPYSVDEFFGGKLRLRQPRARSTATRARVTSDSFWLARFSRLCHPRPKRVLELGAGHGALSSLIAQGRPAHLIAVERDPELAQCARFNLSLTATRWHVIANLIEEASQQIMAIGANPDLIVMNPPFLEPGTGRHPQHDRATSNAGALAPFLRSAAEHSNRNTRIHLCYPASGLEHLLALADRASLHPKVMRFVHPNHDETARLVLAEFRRAKPGGLEVLPPAFEWHTVLGAQQRSQEFTTLTERLDGPRLAARGSRVSARSLLR